MVGRSDSWLSVWRSSNFQVLLSEHITLESMATEEDMIEEYNRMCSFDSLTTEEYVASPVSPLALAKEGVYFVRKSDKGSLRVKCVGCGKSQNLRILKDLKKAHSENCHFQSNSSPAQSDFNIPRGIPRTHDDITPSEKIKSIEALMVSPGDEKAPPSRGTTDSGFGTAIPSEGQHGGDHQQREFDRDTSNGRSPSATSGAEGGDAPSVQPLHNCKKGYIVNGSIDSVKLNSGGAKLKTEHPHDGRICAQQNGTQQMDLLYEGIQRNVRASECAQATDRPPEVSQGNMRDSPQQRERQQSDDPPREGLERRDGEDPQPGHRPLEAIERQMDDGPHDVEACPSTVLETQIEESAQQDDPSDEATGQQLGDGTQQIESLSAGQMRNGAHQIAPALEGQGPSTLLEEWVADTHPYMPYGGQGALGEGGVVFEFGSHTFDNADYDFDLAEAFFDPLVVLDFSPPYLHITVDLRYFLVWRNMSLTLHSSFVLPFESLLPPWLIELLDD